MKKSIKVISILILIIMLMTGVAFATYEIDPSTFSPTYNTDIAKAQRLGGRILGYIINIAAISSVVLIAFFGLKFMLGSVEQKAEYKKYFMPLIIGLFIVLSARVIMGFIWGL